MEYGKHRDPTLYQYIQYTNQFYNATANQYYNATVVEFKTLPVNMSEPLHGSTPILVDLDMFPTCAAEDTA